MNIRKLFQKLFKSIRKFLVKLLGTIYPHQKPNSVKIIPNASRRLTPLKPAVQRDLEELLADLADRGWANEERSWYPKFILHPNDLDHADTLDQVVEILLNHARRTAQNFSVPHFVPYIVVASQPIGVGQFEVDEDGWVTITVSPTFYNDKRAAQAILAHEICHYILENSGIRYHDVEFNERYTDLCMFICGFGEIFLSGYKREPAQREYRPGHRLGYLSDAEYLFAHQYVSHLRESQQLNLQSALTTLKQQLLQLARNDRGLVERLIEYERKRNPANAEVTLCEYAIDRLIRDRR